MLTFVYRLKFMRERPKKMTAFAEAPTQHLSTSDVDPVISYNVKMLLADRGYSQTALGEALGLKRSGVSLKLSGRTTWSGTDMVNAAHFLGVSLDVLVDDSLMRQMKELRGTQNEKPRREIPGRGCSSNRCPRWDSNPHCTDFEAVSSTNWDTGAFTQLDKDNTKN